MQITSPVSFFKYLAVVFLILILGCGDDNDSSADQDHLLGSDRGSEQENILGLIGRISSHQHQLIEVSDSQAQDVLYDLLKLVGESSANSPTLYSRLESEFANPAVDPNGKAEASGAILELIRSADGEIFAISEATFSDQPLFVLSIQAIVDGSGNIVGAPSKSEVYLPSTQVSFPLNVTTAEAPDNASLLSLLVVEDSTGKFSVFAAAQKLPDLELSTTAARGIPLSAGCVAKGTQISTPTGSVAVENINVGDQVVGNTASGEIHTVTNTLVGVTGQPLFKVRTQNGLTVLLTADHPVSTENGFITARNITVGTKVNSTSGTTAVVSVVTQVFTDRIYNLRVNLLSDDLNHSRFYANGIVVGDQAVVQKFTEQRSVQTPPVGNLPPDWQQDYQNQAG